MRIKFKLNLFLVVYFLVFVCQNLVFCKTIKKEKIINNRPHSILGTSFSINNVEIEYYTKIPYAKPPIGNLRFKHPQEIEGYSWSGVYNSTVQPNTCWQADGTEFDILNPALKLWLSKTEMNEDCLYLTIWVPKVSIEKLPVMVWIYGGGFISGSSTLEVYDGSILASKRQVIVVSLQYRLGPLGFLYINENLAPGNQGLMDQRLALKWIKNNIKSFNGDENKITIFGESAGSVSVSLHVLSPLSQNLFNRAIMESGSAFCPWAIESRNDAIKKAIELAKYTKCDLDLQDMDKISECLINVEPSILVNLQFNLKANVAKERSYLLLRHGMVNVSSDASYFFDIPFKPIYDNFFIPKSIPQLIALQKVKKNVQLMMGFNSNEGMFFLLYGLNTWINFFQEGKIVATNNLSSSNRMSRKISEIMLENIMSSNHLYQSLMLSLLYEYRIPSHYMGQKEWTSLEVLAALDKMTGDEHFVCPVVHFGELFAENNPNVYMYNFQHRTEDVKFPKWAGVMHGYEIEYIFGMPFSDIFKRNFYKFTEIEEKLSEIIMTLWTNFAKYGNPTPNPIDFFDTSVSWLPYNVTKPEMFHFRPLEENLFKENEKSKKCKFWTKVIPALIKDFMGVARSMGRSLTWNMLITVFGSLLLIVLWRND